MKVLRLALLLGIAGVMVCAAVVLPLLAGGDDSSAVGRIGPPDGRSAAPLTMDDVDGADLSAVRTHGDLSTWHVEPDEQVSYPTSPPVGGEHAGHWQQCGVYTEPVREENMVHSLEHGTVWITYLPDLAPEEIDRLAGIVPSDGVLSPYPGQEAPVVVTVWGTQLELLGADDPRLPTFIQRYGNGETAPEPMASCHGGVERFESEDSQGA